MIVRCHRLKVSCAAAIYSLCPWYEGKCFDTQLYFPMKVCWLPGAVAMNKQYAIPF